MEYFSYAQYSAKPCSSRICTHITSLLGAGMGFKPWHLAYKANNLPDWYTLRYIIINMGCAVSITRISARFHGLFMELSLRCSCVRALFSLRLLMLVYPWIILVFLVVPMRLELMTSRLKVECSKSNWAKEPGCSFFIWQAEYRPALRMFFANWESRMTCRNDKFSNYTGHQEIPHRNLPT